MDTVRNPENLNNGWGKLFQYGFGGGGVLLSIGTMVLVLIWLLSEDLGGFELRNGTLTAGYFNWHPLLMCLAFLFFMTPATSAFEVFQLKRNTNKQLHGSLQTLAIICIAAAYIIIWDCHVNLSETGLAGSMHSIAGYITMGLVGITWLMGFIMYVLKLGGRLRGELKPLHKRMGLISLMIGYATILMGITEKANDYTGWTLKIAQIIIGLVVGVSVCISFSIIKFVDKKDGFDYESIPHPDDDATVQLM
eukprot:521938_1